MKNPVLFLSAAVVSGTLIFHLKFNSSVSTEKKSENQIFRYELNAVDVDTTKKISGKKIQTGDTTKKDSLIAADSAKIIPAIIADKNVIESLNTIPDATTSGGSTSTNGTDNTRHSKENADHSGKKTERTSDPVRETPVEKTALINTETRVEKKVEMSNHKISLSESQHQSTSAKEKKETANGSFSRYYSNGDIKSATTTNTTVANGYHKTDNSITKNTINKQKSTPAAQAGLLTGGETNDLSKWSLWNDMVKTALDQQISTWKIYPYNRYAVLLQTKDNMPVQGAKVSLHTKSGEIMWEAITDNTGAAQLWKNIYKEMTDTNVAEIKISYKGNEEIIKNPVDYFHGINTKKLKVKYEKPEIVDIAFVVDATASMQDEIDFLKEEMNDIIQKTKNKYENIDLYLGSVFYRCKGNSYVTKHKPLTKDHQEVIDFIREQNSGEGGIESVEEALEVSLGKLNWHDDARTRLLFLVLDEPPGIYDTIVQKLQKQIQLAAKKGVKIIPVVASGKVGSVLQNRNMEYLMRSAALATNGNYIFITDHSGIGNQHTEPIIDNYKVELINDIIIRTIKNNIYMPDEKELIPETVKDTLLINNKEDVVSKYLDSLSEVMSDDDFMAMLLPYTDFKTKDEMKEHLPLEKIDTTAFLNAQKKEVYTLKVYPNPSRGELKAEFNTDTDWLYVADLSGKIIERISSYETRLVDVNLTNYPNGFYMIQYMVKEKWISAKIVLQK